MFNSEGNICLDIEGELFRLQCYEDERKRERARESSISSSCSTLKKISAWKLRGHCFVCSFMKMREKERERGSSICSLYLREISTWMLRVNCYVCSLNECLDSDPSAEELMYQTATRHR